MNFLFYLLALGLIITKVDLDLLSIYFKIIYIQIRC